MGRGICGRYITKTNFIISEIRTIFLLVTEELKKRNDFFSSKIRVLSFIDMKMRI